MNTIYLHLGGNIGNRLLYISKAFVLITKYIGKIIDRSSLYESEPWGFNSDSEFINICIAVKSKLSAREVLLKIRRIEDELGRKREKNKYSSRSIDIDIVFFNSEIINEKDLIIPHPKIQARKFVLVPLYEILPDFIHPTIEKSIEVLLRECKDRKKVLLYKN